MIRATLYAAALACPLAAGCLSASRPPSPEAQSIVESISAARPEIVRLTVHTIPPSGGPCQVVASTLRSKLGQPSDPEDLRAMQDGQTIVLDEQGALDVTVPILSKDGKHTASAGVTLKAKSGADRAELEAEAVLIAREVEAQLARSRAMR